MFFTIEWRDNSVRMIDQRYLPEQEIYRTYTNYEDVARAIKDMVIRGAPAIGVAAAMGLALGAREITTAEPSEWERDFERMAAVIAGTRPTAVNLFWAVERMRQVVREHLPHGTTGLAERLREEACDVLREDIAINRAMGANGQGLLTDNTTVLTHCNAGALATGGYGTALGVIRAAHEAGKHIHVMADETRPFLQGARLTAWELLKDGIPTTLITDNMAGHFMKQKAVDAVIVGADRIAANGDTANKIGTYSVALLAHFHKIPFYVAAPMSTIDFNTPDGARIPIEERPAEEVKTVFGKVIAPHEVNVRNPAFDVTPAEFISAIVTERGVARAPYRQSLAGLAERQR